MKRRRFLTIAGLGGLLAGVVSFKFVTTSYGEAMANLIKDELSFLKLDEQGLNQFISEISQSANTKTRLIMKGYSFMGISASQSGRVNQLVTSYLLSTDFFINKMDETRVVKYIGLYDPHMRPCANPFSHSFYPSESEKA